MPLLLANCIKLLLSVGAQRAKETICSRFQNFLFEGTVISCKSAQLMTFCCGECLKEKIQTQKSKSKNINV